MYLKKVYVKNFRKFKNINLNLGKRLTVISGINGIGKSSLVSLIASAAGTKSKEKELSTDVEIKRLNGKNFQPEFRDYFKIENTEPYSKYRILVESSKKVGSERYNLTKRISFKNDSVAKRGIRPIPRTVPPYKSKRLTVEQAVKDAGSGSGRFLIPTIYLSLTRLMPPAESDLSEKKISPKNKIEKEGLTEFFMDCYNSVLYDSIDKKLKNPSFTNKNIGGKQRKRLALKIKESTNNTISAGQDTLSSIVAALTDFYAIKKKLGDKYTGGLLCIDEFDATLHPSAVLKLLNLLNIKSKELKLQIILTTHSLTVLKEFASMTEKDNENYSLIYFIDAKVPHILDNVTYSDIKADLFGDVSVLQPKIKVFTEDEAGKQLFCSLIHKRNLPEIEKYDIKVKGLNLGGEQLISLPKQDDSFFKILMCPDGD